MLSVKLAEFSEFLVIEGRRLLEGPPTWMVENS
jgi:hypothetical protein